MKCTIAGANAPVFTKKRFELSVYFALKKLLLSTFGEDYQCENDL